MAPTFPRGRFSAVSTVTALALGIAASSHPGLRTVRGSTGGWRDETEAEAQKRRQNACERAEWNRAVEARKAERSARRNK